MRIGRRRAGRENPYRESHGQRPRGRRSRTRRLRRQFCLVIVRPSDRPMERLLTIREGRCTHTPDMSEPSTRAMAFPGVTSWTCRSTAARKEYSDGGRASGDPSWAGWKPSRHSLAISDLAGSPCGGSEPPAPFHRHPEVRRRGTRGLPEHLGGVPSATRSPWLRTMMRRHSDMATDFHVVLDGRRKCGPLAFRFENVIESDITGRIS